MGALEFADKKILVVPYNTSLQTTARAMADKKVGSIIVSDGYGHMIGIITDRDLVCSALAMGLGPKTKISKIMNEAFKYASDNNSLSEIVQLMKSHQIRRVPIVKSSRRGKQKCVGLVSLDDLIVNQAIGIREAGEIIKAQIVPQKIRTHMTQRRDAHKEHTVNRFYKAVAGRISPDKEMATQICFYLLKVIVRLLPAKMAAKFISDLPNLFQEDLLSVKAGPDYRITVSGVIRDFIVKYDLSKDEAEQSLRMFGDGLKNFFQHEEIDFALSKLPEEWQLAFMGEKIVRRRNKTLPVVERDEKPFMNQV